MHLGSGSVWQQEHGLEPGDPRPAWIWDPLCDLSHPLPQAQWTLLVQLVSPSREQVKSHRCGWAGPVTRGLPGTLLLEWPGWSLCVTCTGGDSVACPYSQACPHGLSAPPDPVRHCHLLQGIAYASHIPAYPSAVPHIPLAHYLGAGPTVTPHSTGEQTEAQISELVPASSC